MINIKMIKKKEPAATQCAFSCQAGRGRTTLGTNEIAFCKIKTLLVVSNPNFLFLRHGCCLPSQRDPDLHRVAQDGRDGTHPK